MYKCLCIPKLKSIDQIVCYIFIYTQKCMTTYSRLYKLRSVSAQNRFFLYYPCAFAVIQFSSFFFFFCYPKPYPDIQNIFYFLSSRVFFCIFPVAYGKYFLDTRRQNDRHQLGLGGVKRMEKLGRPIDIILWVVMET